MLVRYLLVVPFTFVITFAVLGVVLVGSTGSGLMMALSVGAALALAGKAGRCHAARSASRRQQPAPVWPEPILGGSERSYTPQESSGIERSPATPTLLSSEPETTGSAKSAAYQWREAGQTVTANTPVFERLPLDAPFRIPGPTRRTVRSFSADGASYNVDVLAQSCSCPDFIERRYAMPHDNLARYCKHMMSVLASSEASFSHQEWIKAILDERCGGPTSAYLLKLTSAPNAVVTTCFDSEWLNIFARRRRGSERISNASGKLKKYGWNMRERRWSYGEAPVGAREIRQLLDEHHL